MRKLVLVIGVCIAGLLPVAAGEEERFPPRPDWQPDFSISNDQVLERMIYYLDDGADIVVFEHGTAVVLPAGLTDADASGFAVKTLSLIFNAHPDFNPLNMDDGNILVAYNHPAYNVVISAFADQHIKTIKARHLEALATDEVLIGPDGANKFNEFGMKALYGRTFMFMDAADPKIALLYRHGGPAE